MLYSLKALQGLRDFLAQVLAMEVLRNDGPLPVDQDIKRYGTYGEELGGLDVKTGNTPRSLRAPW